MLICPVCSAPLTEQERVWKCEKGHSFDIAAEGYCNLLTGKKAGQFIGDNREMVAARRRFLERGLYEPLQRAVCDAVCRLLPRGGNILDAGCGEGYYTGAVAEALQKSGIKGNVLGVDISKTAVRYASKRDKLSRYITASSYRLPIADGSVNLVLSLFAPAPEKEFARILTQSGCVLRVVPGAEHLWELKQAVYDTPYQNREEKYSLSGFTETERSRISYRTELKDRDTISALFSMTPYAHRTPAEGMARLQALEKLSVTLSFVSILYRRQTEQ